MKFWVPLMFEPNDQLLDVARIAETCGYEGLGLADHVAVPGAFASVHPSGENPFTAESSFPDPFITMASMAAVTTTLRFMSYVYILPMRDPFTVAKQVATAAVLSGDRMVLGVGAGWLTEEIALLGHDPRSRGRRMDEMLTIMRDLWDDGWAEHHGEHFDFAPVGMFPTPGRSVPVWVGGKSDAALRRAVRQDGWLGMNYGLDEIEQLLGRLAEIRVETGDTRADFETFVIPNAPPSIDLYRALEAHGVTSTMLMPWYPGDPACASLDAKRAALERAAEEILAAFV
jgi:probable F420-dependent oxidoreductase